MRQELDQAELEACQAAQSDELLALQAILPAGSLAIHPTSSSRLSLRLQPCLPQKTRIRVRSVAANAEDRFAGGTGSADLPSGSGASPTISQTAATLPATSLSEPSMHQEESERAYSVASGSSTPVLRGDGQEQLGGGRARGRRRPRGVRRAAKEGTVTAHQGIYATSKKVIESLTGDDSAIVLPLQSIQLSDPSTAKHRDPPPRPRMLDPTSPPFTTMATSSRAALASSSACALAARHQHGETQASQGEDASPVTEPATDVQSSHTSGVASSSDGLEESIVVSHLPPLQLCLRLPTGYPFHQAPIIESIAAPWISGSATATSTEGDDIRSWLITQLASLWEENPAEVLYAWSEWLREGLWSSEVLGPLADSWGQLTLTERLAKHQPPRLASVLVQHDTQATESAFEGERYACGICLEERPGVKCFKLKNCAHVFCRECLRDYLGSMIEEGYHRQAGSCPDPECTQVRVELEKKNGVGGAEQQSQRQQQQQAQPVTGSIADSELLLLVGEKQLGRLSWLRQKAVAEADPTAAPCPRQGCQTIVVKNKADEGTAYETMRECHACGYCWCAWCNRTWHGRAPCQLSTSVALIEEYMSHEAGSEGALKMELRYGRSNLQRLVKEEMERRANEAWLDSNAKKCPTCHVRIELSFGCNHMTCGNCRTHFCFRCSERLNPLEPYRHFNTPGKDCYQKLFPFAPGALDGNLHEAPPIHLEDAFPPIDPRDIDAWEREEFGLDHL